MGFLCWEERDQRPPPCGELSFRGTLCTNPRTAETTGPAQSRWNQGCGLTLMIPVSMVPVSEHVADDETTALHLREAEDSLWVGEADDFPCLDSPFPIRVSVPA